MHIAAEYHTMPTCIILYLSQCYINSNNNNVIRCTRYCGECCYYCYYFYCCLPSQFLSNAEAWFLWVLCNARCTEHWKNTLTHSQCLPNRLIFLALLQVRPVPQNKVLVTDVAELLQAWLSPNNSIKALKDDSVPDWGQHVASIGQENCDVSCLIL